MRQPLSHFAMRRKVLCGLLLLCVLAGVTACGEQTPETQTPQTTNREESSVSQESEPKGSSGEEETTMDWAA